MITEKIIMPYVLASLHPIVHAAFLVSHLIVELNRSGDITVDEDQIMRASYIMIGAHSMCLLLQWWNDCLEMRAKAMTIRDVEEEKDDKDLPAN